MADSSEGLMSEMAVQLVLEIWGKGLSRLERALDAGQPGSFRRVWAQVCNELADSCPSLDPFAPELSYKGGTLVREVEDLDPDFVADLVIVTREVGRRYRLDAGALQRVMRGHELEFSQPQVLAQSGLAKLWEL